MLAKRIIPCLDVKAGRVVKGTNFVFLRDAGDPVELAAQYEREQADELTFLDITASVEGRKAMLDVIERTAREVFMPLTVGGGISTMEDIRAVLMERDIDHFDAEELGNGKVSVIAGNRAEEFHLVQLAPGRISHYAVGIGTGYGIVH